MADSLPSARVVLPDIETVCYEYGPLPHNSGLEEVVGANILNLIGCSFNEVEAEQLPLVKEIYCWRPPKRHSYTEEADKAAGVVNRVLGRCGIRCPVLAIGRGDN